MILLIAVAVGLTAGFLRALIGRQPYRIVDLKWPVLVLVAFIPQYFAFFAPNIRTQLSGDLVSILQVSSLTILLAFSLLNIHKISFWPISLGFLLNFLVILFNGGLMPISPDTVRKLLPGQDVNWEIGQRLGYGKDIVLTPEMTRLWFFSDRFILPGWIRVHVAFSLGDVFIALGVVWLLWTLGGRSKEKKKEKTS
jgi:hypothetical protein